MTAKDRASWDVKDFLSTLAFFGEIPFLGSFRWVQQWLGQSPKVPGKMLTAPTQKVALLCAAEPDWLTDLQRRLPSLSMRAYVGEQLEQILMAPSSKASAARHELSEADTVVILPDLALETQRSAIAATAKTDAHRNSKSVFDFTQPGCDISPWGSLDDVVMGGVSQGRFTLSNEPTGQVAIFSGITSTDNSGGFSSVRTRNFEPPFNFSGWAGIQLRVKGDGQRYKFILRNSSGWDSPAYIYGFDTAHDEWITVLVPFEEMVPTFRAKSMSNAPAFDPAKTVSFQIMLSKFEYDRSLNPHFTPGAFSLAIAELSVFRPRKGIPLVLVGASDESIKGEQQLALSDAQIDYRFIEPGNGTVLESIVQALT